MGEAKWLIRAINKRNETVQNVGTLICLKQADFLSEKSAELKPLSNLELAKELKISGTATLLMSAGQELLVTTVITFCMATLR